MGQPTTQSVSSPGRSRESAWRFALRSCRSTFFRRREPCRRGAEDGVIAAVVRPLAFAAREDFAHADRLRNLETTVYEAAESASRGSIPRELRKELRAVRDAFAKELSDDERRAAVQNALERLAPYSDPGYAARALALPPSVFPGFGPRRAEVLAKRGVRTVEDLLYRLPTRYDDRRALASVDVPRSGPTRDLRRSGARERAGWVARPRRPGRALVRGPRGRRHRNGSAQVVPRGVRPFRRR